MLKTLLLATLLFCANLPIPVRSQSSPSGVNKSPTQVQFPETSTACISCKPAFDSQVCQPILEAISQSKTTSISNSTLVSCQCSDLFISLFPDCVQCFTETDQLDLVFGSSNIPSQSSLTRFCNSKSMLPDSHATTAMRTTTMTTTTTAAPASTKPSSAIALRSYNRKNYFSLRMVYDIVLLVALGYCTAFS